MRLTRMATAVATLCLAGALPAGLSACSSSTGCTEAGCGSSVTFSLGYDLEAGEPYLVEACVDDFCRTETLEVPEARDSAALASVEVGDLGLQTDMDIVYLALPDEDEGDWSGTHSTSLTVREAESRVVAEHEGEAHFERLQPNGPNCPPVCWTAEVHA